MYEIFVSFEFSRIENRYWAEVCMNGGREDEDVVFTSEFCDTEGAAFRAAQEWIDSREKTDAPKA